MKKNITSNKRDLEVKGLLKEKPRGTRVASNKREPCIRFSSKN